MALTRESVCFCAACQKASAALTFNADGSFLCINCNIETQSANPLAGSYTRVPMPLLSILENKCSSTYQDELQGIMMNAENEVMASTTNQEMNEDETGRWLLLGPDKDDNKTDNIITYAEEVGGYFNLVKDQKEEEQQHQLSPGDIGSDGLMPLNSFVEKEQKQQKKQQQQQQLYGVHPGNNGSGNIFPAYSFEMQQDKKQQHLYHRQLQPQQNISGNIEYEDWKTAFTDTVSVSNNVSVTFIKTGILPESTSNNTHTYRRFPDRTTEVPPNSSLVAPHQFTQTNRDAKVMRYRKKREKRNFQKKIRYLSRKAYAETRLRVHGRFARKRPGADIEVEDHLISTETHG